MEENPFKPAQIDKGDELGWPEPKSKSSEMWIGILLAVFLALTIVAFMVALYQSKTFEKDKQAMLKKYDDSLIKNAELANQYRNFLQATIAFLGHTNVSSMTISNNGGYNISINPNKNYIQRWQIKLEDDRVTAFKGEWIVNTNAGYLTNSSLTFTNPAIKKRLKSAFDR